MTVEESQTRRKGTPVDASVHDDVPVGRRARRLLGLAIAFVVVLKVVLGREPHLA